MKTIVLLSMLILLVVSTAYGQCPGIYLYADYSRISCDITPTGTAFIHMWIYTGARSAAGAEFSVALDACLYYVSTSWEPGIIHVGDPLTGVGVAFDTCEPGWRYLGNILCTGSPCYDIAARVFSNTGYPQSRGYPIIVGCGPEYEPHHVHGGTAYRLGASHPPCEVYGGPDLMLFHYYDIDAPDTALAGEQIPFSDHHVRNEGCSNVSSFTNGYYLSPDSMITTSDVLLATTPACPGLDPCGDTTFTDTVLTIPPGIASGEYYIGVLADVSDAVTEDDETNNYGSRTITIIAPRVWFVLPDGSGDAPTIQAGIDSAAYLDTVLVACGTYHEHDIVMKSGITLMSETGEPDCAIIEADSLGRVMYCDNVDSTTTIEGFTLTEGLASNAHAGGIYLTYSSPTIRRCNIQDNSTAGVGYDGGGVRCTYSSPHFIECMFSGNTAEDDAGGVYCRNYSSARFDYCIFANNTSSDKGGAMLCYDHSNAEIYNCTFYGNSAGLGSGIAAMQTSDLLPENVIISFGTGGGSVFCESGTGCGILLYCSDVYGNAGGDWISCIAGQDMGNGNLTADPLFCGSDTLDFRLELESPCLDQPGCGLIGGVRDSCGLSGVGGESTSPVTFRLHASRPNPSGQSTRIAFSLARSSDIDLAIYDARGRRVTVLADGQSEAGEFEFTWDGTDGHGRQVPPGIYFCHFKAGGKSASQKIVLIR